MSAEDEFEVFYWDQLPRLRRFLARRIGAKEDREDLETIIMTLAWRQFDNRRIDDRTFGWLAGIAGGAIANERRAGRRRGALVDRVISHRGTAGTASAMPDVDALLDADPRVRRALELLSADDCEILLLHEWDECSYAEIAAVTGLSEAAARKRVSRARARFVDLWKAIPEGGEARGA